MNATRFPVVLAAVLASAATLSAQAPALTLRDGDPVGGFAALTSIAEKSVADDGGWVIEVHTDFADPNLDAALLQQDGSLRLREGDALPAATITGNLAARFFDLDLDAAGNLLALVSTGHHTNRGDLLLWNDAAVVVGNTPMPLLTPEVRFNFAYGARANAQRRVLLCGMFDRLEQLYSFDLDSSGTVVAAQMLLREFGPVTGSPFPLRALPQSRNSLALNERNEWMTIAQTGPRTPTDNDWSTGTDGLVLLNGVIVAAEGGPSPVAGRSYAVLFPGSEVALNDLGQHAFTATLDGDMATDFLLVRNGQKYVQDGDVLPALAPHALSVASGAPLFLANSGDLFWFAATDDPDASRDQAFMRNREVLVQEGVTQVGGLTVVRVPATSDGFGVSPSGRFWLGSVVLQGDLDAMLSLDFGAALPLAGCASNPATLQLASGGVRVGQSITLAMDGSPAVGTLPLLYASLGTPVSGLSGCGVPFSTGELLIDPAQLVGAFAAPVFTGPPSTFTIAIPASAGLVDVRLYMQGAFFDAAHALPGPDVTLSRGLLLEIGAP